MSSNRLNSRRQSSKIAFCGLMTALSVVLLLSGGLIPVATYCAPMLSGLLLLPVLLEYGKKSAWTTYAAVALITLLMDADKEAAFFYTFLGYYPILKWELERIKSKPAKILIKFIIFNTAVVSMYMILGFLLNMHALIEEFSQMGIVLTLVFLAVLNVCLFLYDRLLVPMIFLYVKKISPRLKFLRR